MHAFVTAKQVEIDNKIDDAKKQLAERIASLVKELEASENDLCILHVCFQHV